MPWRTSSVMEQRWEFVKRAQPRREPLAQLCREFGISRPTGYLWLRRYEQARTLTALQCRSRRPQRSPLRTAVALEQRVVALRERTHWGARKLCVLLREQEQMELPARTIHRILQRHDLVIAPVPGAAPGRFERSEPNQLWQMDSKAKYTVEDGECHPLVILDDCSRYLVGLHALPRLAIEVAVPCLLTTFRQYGVPQAMLMDRGSLWWSPTNGWGLTSLSVGMIEQGITLLFGRARHPQTQGKVERVNRTIGEELRYHGEPRRLAQWPATLEDTRQRYNWERPHEALGMQRPAQRYRRSERKYEERPREWEYAAGSDVRRLDANGTLNEAGRHWFVCEALAGKTVCVERFDGKLLVSYRHMYVREIDVAESKTRSLVVARAAGGTAAAVAPPAPAAALPPVGSKTEQRGKV
jgi:transposase InsO family protein